jgi:Zn-dependent M28 family amino/carboxypeptidase
MMGAHTDSVQKGPGIEDDGTGTIGILTAALALTGFEVTNAVRLGFWTGEEFGLRGSTFYVTELNKTASELAKIRAYLNCEFLLLLTCSGWKGRSPI